MPAAPADFVVTLRDNADEHRFEAIVGDRVVAFADYRALRGRIVVLHTEVDTAFEGRGVGRRLAQ